VAVTPRFLIDNSAYNRLKYSSVQDRIHPLLSAQLVATCAIIELEALFSATGKADYEQLQSQRGAILTYLETDESDFQQALTVQHELAKKSQHRGAKLPDLILAAVAFRYELTLLHYDSDFDRITGVTGQNAEWVVPRGSVP
jgi:predicted nucleic acid-binding protein